jgi:hypothetical protein
VPKYVEANEVFVAIFWNPGLLDRLIYHSFRKLSDFGKKQ